MSSSDEIKVNSSKKSRVPRWAYSDGACWCYVYHVHTFAQSCAESSSPKFTHLTHTITSTSKMLYLSFIIAVMVFVVQSWFCVTSMSVQHWPSYSTAYLYHQSIPRSQQTYQVLSSVARWPQLPSHRAKDYAHHILGQCRSSQGWWRVTEWCTLEQERQGGIGFGASLIPFLDLPIAFSPDPFGYLSALSCNRTRWIKKSCC